MKKLHCLRIKFVDDDDDDNDDDELFFLYGCLTKGVKPYFQPAPLSEILTVTDIPLAAIKL